MKASAVAAAVFQVVAYIILITVCFSVLGGITHFQDVIASWRVFAFWLGIAVICLTLGRYLKQRANKDDP